jgi:tetratricopeptide (TPR) repeat protein
MLMRLLAQAGQQTAALRQYQECARVLQAEVGVSPEPETTALYETIVRVGAALWLFWMGCGDATEARDRVAAILPLVHRVPPTPAAARALHGAGLLAERLGDYATCRLLLDAGIAVARQLDDRRLLADLLDALGRQEVVEGHWLAQTLNNLGSVQTVRGEYAAARSNLREALSLARTMGNGRWQAYVLGAVATLAAVTEQAERAVRLDGAASGAAEALGAVLARPTYAQRAEYIARARQMLGEQVAVAAATAGRAMTLDQAVDDALSWLGEADGAAGIAASIAAIRLSRSNEPLWRTPLI